MPFNSPKDFLTQISICCSFCIHTLPSLHVRRPLSLSLLSPFLPLSPPPLPWPFYAAQHPCTTTHTKVTNTTLELGEAGRFRSPSCRWPAGWWLPSKLDRCVHSCSLSSSSCFAGYFLAVCVCTANV